MSERPFTDKEEVLHSQIRLLDHLAGHTVEITETTSVLTPLHMWCFIVRAMNQSELPELSQAEWLLMNVCWKTGRATARQVFEHIESKKTWEYQTVKTMLDRMAGKGYLKLEKLGPLCLFEPIAKKPKTVARAIDRFLETVMDDSLDSLVVHLAKKKKLSASELEELKELFREEES